MTHYPLACTIMIRHMGCNEAMGNHYFFIKLMSVPYRQAHNF